MRDITLCHPRLQKIAAAWIKACAVEGITVAISETLRTAAEQDALYAQGRTKPGNIVTNAKGSSYKSQHQWGIAFDFNLKKDVDGDGKISDDAYNDSKGHFKHAAAIGHQGDFFPLHSFQSLPVQAPAEALGRLHRKQSGAVRCLHHSAVIGDLDGILDRNRRGSGPHGLGFR